VAPTTVQDRYDFEKKPEEKRNKKKNLRMGHWEVTRTEGSSCGGNEPGSAKLIKFTGVKTLGGKTGGE